MIRREQLTEVGSTLKTHGVKGEISLLLDDDLAPDDLRCFIFEIDGLFVPFFAETTRPRGGDSWLVKFDGINSERDAESLCRHSIYALSDELPGYEEDPDGVNLYDLVGFTLLNDDDSTVGTIDDIDDSTANILLLVTDAAGNTIYVPFVEDLITALDIDNCSITMNIPNGIINLN